jgi:hypothetical protein
MKALTWQYASMTGCTVDGSDVNAAFLDTVDSLQIHGNTFLNCGRIGDALHSVVYLASGTNVAIGPNRIPANTGNRYTVAYDVNVLAGTGVVIDSTGAAEGSRAEIVENDAPAWVKIDGTYMRSIPDDTAVSLKVGGIGKQGLVQIAMQSATSSSPRGLYWVRTSPASFDPISVIPAANVILTAGVLTGTTGIDGNVTMSTHTDGNLYIENRAGTARKIGVKFLQ